MNNDIMVTYLDPMTGGYILLNNSLVTAPPVVSKANRLLKQVIGQDIANSTWGNPLLTITRFLTPDEIATGLNTCLDPLIQNGEISKVTITNMILSVTKRWKVNMQLDLPAGNYEILQWTEK